jgi:hypothetical protein
MHKFSTVSAKPSALPVLRDPQAGAPGLLKVPYSTFAGASVARLVRPAFSPLRDENLCIIPARVLLSVLLLIFLANPLVFQLAGQRSGMPGADQPDWALLLPEGEGKSQVQNFCVGCHDLKIILSQRNDSYRWRSTLDRMISEGAPIYRRQEIEIVTKYLTEHFGPTVPLVRFPLNVNTATPEQLLRLPQMSEKEVREIIQLRERAGGFRDMMDIEEVVGQEKFDLVRYFIALGPSQQHPGRWRPPADSH